MVTAGTALVPHAHAVSFYDHDAELVAQLADFVAEGLRCGEGVAVVATPEHRSGLEQVLAQRGVARDPSAYVVVDAAEVLATFLVDGVLRDDLFVATVGGLLDRAATGGRPVRVFGEMVALLWEDGDVAGALELEGRWNALAQVREFALLCAYPTAALADGSGLAALAAVCSGHSDVLAPVSYGNELLVAGRPVAGGRIETFVPVPESVQMVRRFVSCTLQAWREPGLVADAQLVVSELATNALQHAVSPYSVCVTRAGSVVRIAVTDVAPVHPELQDATEDGVSGRGMALVEAVSARWGVADDPAGKVVWVELEATRR